MPKPVLSDSLFNADDVADAIINSIDLSVLNVNLAVSDISSSFTYTSAFTVNSIHSMHFNGFVFYSAYVIHYGSSPSSGDKIGDITNSNYRPPSNYQFPAIGFEGDVGSSVEIKSNGEILLHNPTNTGNNNYYVVLNGFWNVNY